MIHETYAIVDHDGGWAYKVGNVFSETFASRDEAHRAAEQAAGEQRVAGATEGIEYQTSDGSWHQEVVKGDDRPETDVKDCPPRWLQRRGASKSVSTSGDMR